MENLPEEIISQIFLISDFKTLKKCHLVCRKWCRIATEFLFHRVVCHKGNRGSFSQILVREDLSKFIKVISFGQTAPAPSDTISDLISSILSHDTLRKLIKRPTVGIIRRPRVKEYIATLTGIDALTYPSVLPALEEIQLFSKEVPYSPIELFSELRKLHIDIEHVWFRHDYVWPSLVDLHLRGNYIDIDHVKNFLENHHHIRQLHFTFVATLHMLDLSPSTARELSRNILDSELDAGLGGSIMRNAEDNANGHERLLLRNIHAQLDQIPDGCAKKIKQALITAFETELENKLQKWYIKIGGIQTLQTLKLSCSIAWFWEDELAIKGMRLPENHESKSGLWMNEEFEGRLGKSYVFKRLVEPGVC